MEVWIVQSLCLQYASLAMRPLLSLPKPGCVLPIYWQDTIKGAVTYCELRCMDWANSGRFSPFCFTLSGFGADCLSAMQVKARTESALPYR
jgi:hypothetical protein